MYPIILFEERVDDWMSDLCKNMSLKETEKPKSLRSAEVSSAAGVRRVTAYNHQKRGYQGRGMARSLSMDTTRSSQGDTEGQEALEARIRRREKEVSWDWWRPEVIYSPLIGPGGSEGAGVDLVWTSDAHL